MYTRQPGSRIATVFPLMKQLPQSSILTALEGPLVVRFHFGGRFWGLYAVMKSAEIMHPPTWHTWKKCQNATHCHGSPTQYKNK